MKTRIPCEVGDVREGGKLMSSLILPTDKRLVSGSLVGNIFAQWIVLFVIG